MTRGRRVLALLRRELGPIVGVSFVVIPIGLASSFCLLGLPVLAWGLGSLIRATLSAAEATWSGRPPAGARGDGGGWRVGVYASLGLAAVIAGAGFAASVALHFVDPAASGAALAVGAAVALVASVGIGAALAPLSFAPFFAADGVEGLVRPLLRSFELASRSGPRRAATVGALAGLAVGLSLLLVALLFRLSAPDADAPSIAMLAAPFGIIAGPPIAAALWADAYVEAKRRVASNADLDVRLGARSKAILGLLVPVAAALFAALVLAAATPTAMRPTAWSERGFEARGFDPHFGITTAPYERPIGDGHVTARTTERGVRIEAHDGGGAGAVDARFDTRQSAIAVRPGVEHGGPPGSLAVVVVTDDEAALTLIDADGVRLDDGLSERVFGRLGVAGAAAFLVGLALAFALVFVIAAELGAARGLSAPALLESGAAREGGLAALPGTLRLGEGARARYRPASLLARLLTGRAPTLVVQGDGWVEAEAGALRFRLPDAPVAVLRGVDVRDWNGQTVVLLSRFARVAPRGLRDAWTPWPEDGRLVFGETRDAAEALLARTGRVASFLAVPVMAAWSLSTVLLLSSL